MKFNLFITNIERLDKKDFARISILGTLYKNRCLKFGGVNYDTVNTSIEYFNNDIILKIENLCFTFDYNEKIIQVLYIAKEKKYIDIFQCSILYLQNKRTKDFTQKEKNEIKRFIKYNKEKF